MCSISSIFQRRRGAAARRGNSSRRSLGGDMFPGWGADEYEVLAVKRDIHQVTRDLELRDWLRGAGRERAAGHRVRDWHDSTRRTLIKRCLAFDQLEDQRPRGRTFLESVDLCDMRMVERGERLGLA